ncbi:bifunctional metallophosphatase/5'-nucleotidase [Candidatus Marifrigoribacter sp. Uisw_064]|uniref:bifunctional metallophosphatase/5'-nucleotidase n=1 Tax=Candidatus Marifrigoribacter sp. Uisw_064 TaxID=3230970 RepID=UPI003D4224BD
MKKLLFLATVLSLVFFGCKEDPSKHEITFKFVQLNDVYEIGSLSGGKYGGMDRVAYVRDSIQKENPNTFMFMAGDFLNPSLLGTIKVNGERISGKQMIEVMNAMDFDLVTFGNHEFDLKERDLQKRLNESNFPWITSNVLHKTEAGNTPFTIQKETDTIPVQKTHVFNIKDVDGTEIKVGFLSVTLPSNPQAYVYYGDQYELAEKTYNELKNEVDIVMGLTHLAVNEDIELLKKIPGIPFIMGGHEHNAMLVNQGESIIAKADANAKTIYIHTVSYSTKTKKTTIDSHLFPIDETTPSKPEVASIIGKWNRILELKIKEVIDDPNEVIYTAEDPLDGTDSANRSIQTNLGDVLTEAMAWSYNNEVDAALINGGSIRIDDMLPASITSLDVFRVLPFGGEIFNVDIKGSLLKEVLDYGKSKRGTGAYLQRNNVSVNADNGDWLIGDQPIIPSKTYKVAFSDFLLKGYDIPFLTPDNQGVVSVYEPKEGEPGADIRKAIILYLKSLNE